eukprot:s830_g3.t2
MFLTWSICLPRFLFNILAQRGVASRDARCREEPKEAARAAEAAKTIYKKEKDVVGQVESLSLVAQAHMYMVSKLDASEEPAEERFDERIFRSAQQAGSSSYRGNDSAFSPSSVLAAQGIFPDSPAMAPLKLNPMISEMEESTTVAIFSKVSNMKSRGEKVNGALCVGQPDFAPPPEAIQATQEAAVKGLTSYTAVTGPYRTGTLELRQAVAEYLEKYKKVKYSPDEVLIACGGKQAIYQVVMALCQKGDEVIDIVKLSGATPVILETTAAQGYAIDAKKLNAAITPRTRLVCNPSNPTGCAMGKSQVEEVAEVLRQPQNQHVLVLSDEIYERICYDGKEHASFAALKDMWERTLTINGFSKAFSMTGYRLGYLAAPKEIVKAASKLQSQRLGRRITSCASSVAQHAGIAALQCDMSYISGKVAELEKKRDLALDLLAKIPEIQCPKPGGAFYLFPDISAYFGRSTADGKDATQLCLHLLEEYRVALVPGDAFGDGKLVPTEGPVHRSYITEAGQLPAVPAEREEGSHQLKVCHGPRTLQELHSGPLRGILVSKEGPLKENRLNIAGSKAYVATDEAMAAIKDCKDDGAIATANFSRAEVLSLFGETRESVSAGRRACEAFRRTGEQQPLAVALMLCARGFLELGTAGLAEKSAEEALDIFHRISDDEGVAAANELLNEIGPSGMALGGGGSYEVEAIAAAPEPGAAASVAVQQKGPEPAQVKEMIRKEVESILGSADEVADDTPLMDTGLDSLSSVQFRNDLTRDFNVKLPASLMFDYPTITALTEKIVQALEDQ